MSNSRLLQAVLPLFLFEGGGYEGKKRSSSKVSGVRYHNVPKGNSIFNIDGKRVMALNHKNAVRKANAGKVWGRLTTSRINLERWIYRRKRRHEDSIDIDRQLAAISKANKLAKKRKCKLWVIRIKPGSYRIYSKGDVKAVLRALGMKGRVDMFSINGTVVYITK